MRNLWMTITATISVIQLQAQQDPKAKAILDKVSAENKAYQTIKAEFTYLMQNKVDGINEKQNGTLLLKGNKFHLTLEEQEIFFDGKNIYTILRESKEIQINNPPQENQEDAVLSPGNLFSIYEKGFKYNYGNKETINGQSLDLILLYPEKPQNKNYHTVKLYINTKNQIQKIIILGKDGTTFTYEITKFLPNEPINDAIFTFNKSKYPNFEINDLRE